MNTQTTTEKIDFPKGLLESLGFEALDEASIGSLSTELAKYKRAHGLMIAGIKDLQAQRDELLAALKQASMLLEPHIRKMSIRNHFSEINAYENTIRKAIENAKKGD